MGRPNIDGATQDITAFPSEQAYDTNQTNEESYFSAEQVIRRGQDLVRRAVNYATVDSYFELGRMIVERQQGGKDRAEYGEHVLEGLSAYLSSVVGKGYSVRSLTCFRRFYLTYRNDQISHTAFAKLEGSTNLQIAYTGRKTFPRWLPYLRPMRIPTLQLDAAGEAS